MLDNGELRQSKTWREGAQQAREGENKGAYKTVKEKAQQKTKRKHSMMREKTVL